MMIEFLAFNKIARLSRNCTITEKIDGTNASIYIGEDGGFLTGSRNKWITPEDDNYNFARWAQKHRDELMTLGPGLHFGEWWGNGVQRKYDQTKKRFSLFNTSRWCMHGTTPKETPTADPRIMKTQDVLPECCDLVPILFNGPFSTNRIEYVVEDLRINGSKAAPGFMQAEGVMIYHDAAQIYFKKTLERDTEWKGKK